MTKTMMTSTVFAAALAGLAALASPAAAQSEAPTERPGVSQSDPKFLGIDLDKGRVYYNGRNSGVYCIYETLPVYNRNNGYVEYRRTRRCGRGLYL